MWGRQVFEFVTQLQLYVPARAQTPTPLESNIIHNQPQS